MNAHEAQPKLSSTGVTSGSARSPTPASSASASKLDSKPSTPPKDSNSPVPTAKDPTIEAKPHASGHAGAGDVDDCDDDKPAISTYKTVPMPTVARVSGKTSAPSKSETGSHGGGKDGEDDCEEDGAVGARSTHFVKAKPTDSGGGQDKGGEHPFGPGVGANEEDCDDEAATHGTHGVEAKPTTAGWGHNKGGNHPFGPGVGADEEDCENESSQHGAAQVKPAPTAKPNNGSNSGTRPTGQADGAEDCEEDGSSPYDLKSLPSTGGRSAGNNGSHNNGKGGAVGAHVSAGTAATASAKAAPAQRTGNSGASKANGLAGGTHSVYAKEDCDEHDKQDISPEKRDSGATSNVAQAKPKPKPSGATGRVYAPFGPYKITDQPEFGWRGLMLDTSRNYFSPKVMKKVSEIPRLIL